MNFYELQKHITQLTLLNQHNKGYLNRMFIVQSFILSLLDHWLLQAYIWEPNADNEDNSNTIYNQYRC